MRRLVDVEPETQATIRKIEGGEDIKKHLEDLGINRDGEIRVLEQAPRHEHKVAISLSMDDREIILGHGMADFGRRGQGNHKGIWRREGFGRMVFCFGH